MPARAGSSRRLTVSRLKKLTTKLRKASPFPHSSKLVQSLNEMLDSDPLYITTEEARFMQRTIMSMSWVDGDDIHPSKSLSKKLEVFLGRAR